MKVMPRIEQQQIINYLKHNLDIKPKEHLTQANYNLDDIQQKIKNVNTQLQIQPTNLKLKLSQINNKLQIHVIDTKNNQIIQSIPPDAILKIEEALQNGKGLFLNKNF
ncbi:MAG: flagellar protein FlaG [Desulfonauticus sp.]|nr:flagellar protein FlaG [Desulfonauticus sp.]